MLYGAFSSNQPLYSPGIYSHLLYPLAVPVHTPVAFSSSPLAQVLPEPGKLARATAERLLPFIK